MMAQAIPREARYWDRIAKKYAARPVSDEASYQRKLEMTRAHLRPTDRVLELGAGTGSTALVHAPFVAEIRATDISGSMMEIARKKAAKAGVNNVTFERASDEELVAEAGSVDVVLALNLLHLVSDPKATMARIHQWLKPGGLLVASTAPIADMMPIFRVIGPPLAWIGFFPKVAIFRRASYEAWLKEAGFEVVEAWDPPGKMSGQFHILRAV